MSDKKQISASIETELAEEVQQLAKAEDRSFSKITEILLMEALVARSNKKIRDAKKVK